VCDVCGAATDTPPECGRCFTEADQAARRREDRALKNFRPLSPAVMAARAAQQRRARLAAALIVDLETALAAFAAPPRQAESGTPAGRSGKYRGRRGGGAHRRHGRRGAA
jgi:hypothetical protein